MRNVDEEGIIYGEVEKYVNGLKESLEESYEVLGWNKRVRMDRTKINHDRRDNKVS